MQHRFDRISDDGRTAVFLCRHCKTMVCTPGALPNPRHSEVWGGVVVKATHPRPRCKEAP